MSSTYPYDEMHDLLNAMHRLEHKISDALELCSPPLESICVEVAKLCEYALAIDSWKKEEPEDKNSS